MFQNMFQDIVNFQEELINLLANLCRIPAPSGQEDRRAEYIRQWLETECQISAVIDDAKNALVPINLDSPGSMPLFMAHTDTVFPDTEPMPCILSSSSETICSELDNHFLSGFPRNIDRISSPGVGDDTACVAILMLYLKYYKDTLLALGKPLLFAFNSCEEGLGNLKGCRRIMQDYGHRISHVTSFDGGVNGICNHAVGSLRYEITIHTRGGHSYNDFGNRNAIQAMCQLIQQLYQMQAPSTGRNTYNIGTISGGTSVNTIAQSCSCLFEYRSDTKANLEWMNQYFLQSIETMIQKNPDIRLEINLVGERPCMGDVDTAAQKWLTDLALESILRVSDSAFLQEIVSSSFRKSLLDANHSASVPVIGAGSTDCNIPLSMGIPAICFGGLLGDGVHTREEYVTVPLLMQEAYIMEDYLYHILTGLI